MNYHSGESHDIIALEETRREVDSHVSAQRLILPRQREREKNYRTGCAGVLIEMHRRCGTVVNFVADATLRERGRTQIMARLGAWVSERRIGDTTFTK